jgi:hypothetical protein
MCCGCPHPDRRSRPLARPQRGSGAAGQAVLGRAGGRRGQHRLGGNAAWQQRPSRDLRLFVSVCGANTRAFVGTAGSWRDRTGDGALGPAGRAWRRAAPVCLHRILGGADRRDTGAACGRSGSLLQTCRGIRLPPLRRRAAGRPGGSRRHPTLHHYALWRDALPDDPYWLRASSAARLAGHKPKRPALFTGGWFDCHLTGTIDGFRALAATSHLLIGPWVHLRWAPRGAGADFGPAAQSDVDVRQAAFFAHALADAERPAWMREGRVRLFDPTRRAWRLFDAWPEPEPLVLHLGGNGQAALREDGGWLTADPPPAPHDERFVHDPWRPVPAETRPVYMAIAGVAGRISGGSFAKGGSPEQSRDRTRPSRFMT